MVDDVAETWTRHNFQNMWNFFKHGKSASQVWELCQQMIESNGRYAWMANPDIPLCDLASLNWISHSVPSSPAPVNESAQSTIPCVRRVGTRTHTPTCTKTWCYSIQRGQARATIFVWTYKRTWCCTADGVGYGGVGQKRSFELAHALDTKRASYQW